MTDEIFVYCDVPIKVREAVTKNEDGSFSIFINPALDHKAMQRAYLHALWHIEHDFEGGDVQEIEAVAHSHSPL